MSRRLSTPADVVAPEAGPITRLSARTGTLASGGAPRTTAAPAPVRTFLRPRWFAVHLTTVAVVVATVLLGRWQLDVSNSRHFDLQNFGYTLQYWAFAAFTIFFWYRIVRDARRPPVQPPQVNGQLVRPAGPVTSTTLSHYAGPADLAAPSADGGSVVYRGYVTPRSATALVRSHGDRYHDAYNDYLWQLGMTDRKRADAGAAATVALTDGSPADRSLDADAPRELPGPQGPDHP